MFFNQKLYRFISLTVGILFFIYGINDLFHINLLPKATSLQKGEHFVNAIMTTGYLYSFMKIVEIIMGALFIFNKFIPLVVISLLTPYVLNYFLFALFLNQTGLPMATLALIGNIYFLFYFKDKYKHILNA
ncbi:MAG: hypothetical protein LEGION0398_MBIBDBAK_00863 [Legionellaceae bacterium]